jgi:hypothetical protein
MQAAASVSEQRNAAFVRTALEGEEEEEEEVKWMEKLK